MRVIYSLEELQPPPAACVLTIGNFDGVHLAHRLLLDRVVELARGRGAVAAAITFEPHPIKFLSPARAPKLLTPFDRKVKLIATSGLDLLVVLPFNEELAHFSPLEFVRRIVRPLHTTVVHVGMNFRFGYRQAGDVQILEELGRQEGFQVEVRPLLDVRGQTVSSSRVRELLREGRVRVAHRLLGRPFSVYGPIVAGLGVGHKHTVPTLNLAPVEEQLPKTGVYVTRARVGRNIYDAVTNVGHRPTFGDNQNLVVETFLLNFAGGEIVEPDMEIEFFFRLRDEIKFPNPAFLKAQIQKDAGRGKRFFQLLRTFREPQARADIPQTVA
jgi:riboflavin kinase/FMN adenylyltransferase